MQLARECKQLASEACNRNVQRNACIRNLRGRVIKGRKIKEIKQAILKLTETSYISYSLSISFKFT